MQGKYENNPINELANSIRTELNYHMLFKNELVDMRGYKELENILKLILINNGCKLSEDSNQYEYTYDIIKDEYQLCFITGMIGNDANEYYDFIIFHGMKILIIFIDYFNIIENIDKEDQMHDLKNAMGNSVYYDAIKKIVEVFYLTSEPNPGGLLTTAMCTTQRWNCSIIAIHTLNDYKDIDDNDVSDIPIEEVKRISEGNMQLQLYGIRVM